MAVRGTKPKPAGQAVTRHEPTHEWTEVLDVPFVGGPRLPRRSGGWPAATKRWWAVVSAMPHCTLWTEADWQYAFDTAEVHARFSLGETAATELRIREKPMGVTLDARRDLRIRYVRAATAQAPVAEVPANVTNLDDYRDVLGD